MQKEKKNLLSNFLSLGALQIFSYVMPLITLPYLSRVLGAEMFGLVFFAQAFMEYFIMLTDYGFGLSAVREIAVNRHNQNNLSNIFSAVTTIKFILLGISFGIILLAIAFIPKLHDNWLIFILTFLMVVGNAIYPVWFFQGMERMKYITFLNILARIVSLILIFIFVKEKTDYLFVPLLNSLGFMLSGIIGLVFAFREFKIKLYIPSGRVLWKQFKYSSEFFLSRASLSLYTNTNAFCLGLIGSNILVGYYVAAEKIYRAVIALVYPISGALYPYVAKYKDIKTYKKVAVLAILTTIFICLFTFIFAKNIITIFYGAEMINAYKVLRIFCCAIIFDVGAILIGFPLLAALGYTKETNGSNIISAIVHIIGLLTLYLSGIMNIYSIAIMAAISSSLLFFVRLFFVNKYKLLREKIVN